MFILFKCSHSSSVLSLSRFFLCILERVVITWPFTLSCFGLHVVRPFSVFLHSFFVGLFVCQAPLFNSTSVSQSTFNGVSSFIVSFRLLLFLFLSIFSWRLNSFYRRKFVHSFCVVSPVVRYRNALANHLRLGWFFRLHHLLSFNPFSSFSLFILKPFRAVFLLLLRCCPSPHFNTSDHLTTSNVVFLNWPLPVSKRLPSYATRSRTIVEKKLVHNFHAKVVIQHSLPVLFGSLINFDSL